jgi:hypothetical protein
MAGNDTDLGPLVQNPLWVPPEVPLGEKVWTDDFSNIIEHFAIER